MAEIGVRVTVTGAEDGQKKVQGVADAVKKIEGSSADANKNLVALGVTLGATLVAAAGFATLKLKDAVVATTQLGDKFHNLSQQTGIAVEKLSGGLRLAAETSNSSVEGLAQGVNLLNRSISAAADGTGRQADAFKRLGIDVKDASGKLKDTDQILGEIADAFSKSENGAVKTEIAMTLLGRSGANLIPLLNQGSEALNGFQKEAEQLGLVMSTETAAAAAKLNENLRILQGHAEGFKIKIATPIIEELAAITTAMRQASQGGAGLFMSLGAGLTAQTIPQMEEGVARTSAEIKRLEAIKKTARRGEWSGVHEQQLQAQYMGLQRALHDLGIARGEGVEGPQTSIDLGPSTAALDAKAIKAIEQREQEIQAIRHRVLTENEKRELQQLEIMRKRAEEARTREEVDNMIQVYDYESQLIDEGKRQQIDAIAEVNDYWEQVAQRRAEAQSTRANLEAIFGGQPAIEEFARGLHTGLTAELANLFRGRQGLGGFAGNVGQLLIDEIIRGAARKTSGAILDPIFKKLEPLFKGGWEKVLNGVGPVFEQFWTWLSGGFSSLFASISLGAMGMFGGIIMGAIDILRNPSQNAAASLLGLPTGVSGFLSELPIVGDVVGGFGDFLGDLFPMGTDMVVSSPRAFIAGDAGPERVTVSPLAGAARHGMGGGSGTVVFSGLNIVDDYTMRRARRQFMRGR